jgi:hypothetical protein
MQYWYSKKLARVERLENEVFDKHPEKLESLESQGFIRVNGEDDFSPYKKSFKKKKKK